MARQTRAQLEARIIELASDASESFEPGIEAALLLILNVNDLPKSVRRGLLTAARYSADAAHEAKNA